jgi:UDP-N-acetylmuramoyl-L-alanyl-D-glutamate--2,6-diaminopimelate ligase
MMPELSVAPGRPLVELLAGLAAVAPGEDRAVGHLTLDSREVERGTLFAAVAGTRRHGLEFVDAVLRRGAAAIVWEPDPRLDPAAAERACAAAGVPLLMVPELGMQLSRIAGRFFGEPSRQLALIGVTGTDGKTSVSQFIAQALSGDRPCGVIGTLGYGLLDGLLPPTHTTPDAITVQRLLKDMRDRGARYAAMEVSSHALAQGRVAGLHYRVAALTNLSRDHLDYHGTEEAYAAAKAKLFAMPGLEYAVLNHDDRFGRRLKRMLPRSVTVFDYSLDPHQREAALCCRRLRHLPDGLALQVETPVGAAELSVPLLGRFNAANALAALATLLALGLPLPDAAVRLQGLQPVTGRMQRFGGGGLPTVIVDYAHTPAGLAAALDAVRQHTAGRVWCVFGCGGDRDRGKRPQMADVADRKADEIVITDDNPRSEDPRRIVGDILAGIEGHEPFIVRDRAAAIRLAIEQAGPVDAVLIAGKGHEDYQIVGSRRLPFDDGAVVRAALQERAQWNR